MNGPLFRIFSIHSAVTPATCGQAMLVPFIATSPPPGLAEMTPTPGPATFAPVFENGAILKPAESYQSAATEMIPSDTAGGLTAISKFGSTCLSLSLPAAATMMVGCVNIP